MYAHPSFIRGRPELLSELKKSSSVSRRRLSKVGNDDSDSSSTDSHPTRSARSVSPSPPPRRQVLNGFHNITQKGVPRPTYPQVPSAYLGQTWLTFNKPTLAPRRSNPMPSFPRKGGIGRLDLLALAIEHAR